MISDAERELTETHSDSPFLTDNALYTKIPAMQKLFPICRDETHILRLDGFRKKVL